MVYEISNMTFQTGLDACGILAGRGQVSPVHHRWAVQIGTPGRSCSHPATGAPLTTHPHTYTHTHIHPHTHEILSLKSAWVYCSVCACGEVRGSLAVHVCMFAACACVGKGV
jgi:hypothetical protein